MSNKIIPELYKQYFIDKNDERRVLFQKIRDLYQSSKGLYPGSFVHITPSFYIQDMTYIDSDKRIARFFGSESLGEYVDEIKDYNEKAIIQGIQKDYSSDLPIEESSFDIMFSFYAGFISKTCKKYLKAGGILLVNNSHGDASLAFADKDYELIAVVKRNGNDFRISDKDLHRYFIKKDGSPIDTEKVRKRMIGENFTIICFAYIFTYKPCL